MMRESTPRIRFSGFTDVWEQRKLSDIYKDIGNAFVGTATPYYVEKGHFYLESNNIKDGQINHNTEVFINDEFYEKQKEKWLHTGDMVMVQSGHVGHAAVIPKELDCSAAHALIMFRNPKVEIEPYYLNYQYQTTKAKKKIKNITTGNTIKHILASEMQEYVVDVASYGEQKKIADFFRGLDNLITLHQRKCDETKELKYYMVQKLFPKKGESFPEIRFVGYTEAWEQRKLGKVCERVTRKNKNGESDRPLTIASQFGLIDQRDFFSKVVAAKDMSNYYLLKKGEFAYNKSYSNGFDYGSIKRLNNYEQGCLSMLYICFGLTSDDVESDYLECYFDTLKWYGDVSQICAEGARNHGLLNVDTKAFFDEVTIEMPSSKSEQRKISAYLNNLDNLITLHQRRCDEMKEMKKYMLQNMFPQKG